MKNKKYFQGFTLIELLVVVAIIGLLASVVLVSLGGARDSAKVARMVSDFNQMEKAMIAWGLSEGWVEWPEDKDFGFGYGPTPQQLMESTNFSEYLSQAPVPPFGEGDYRYGRYGSVGQCGRRGATMTVFGIDTETAQKFENVIDGEENSDFTCGKIRYEPNTGNGALFYTMSQDNSI